MRLWLGSRPRYCCLCLALGALWPLLVATFRICMLAQNLRGSGLLGVFGTYVRGILCLVIQAEVRSDAAYIGRVVVKVMARNRGTGGRTGAVRGRTQFRLPNGHYAKVDRSTGRILSVKADRAPYKGIVIMSAPTHALRRTHERRALPILISRRGHPLRRSGFPGATDPLALHG